MAEVSRRLYRAIPRRLGRQYGRARSGGPDRRLRLAGQRPLQAVSKAEVLREMAEPLDELCPGRTAEEVERALTFLVEQGMVDVEGNQITVPARFQQVDKAG